MALLAITGSVGPQLTAVTYQGDPTPELRLGNVCVAPVLEPRMQRLIRQSLRGS